MTRYGLILLGMLCMHTVSAVAQDKVPPGLKVEELTLSVTPAAEPRPALEYSLWTPDRELQPGNSAPYYYRAMLLRQQQKSIAEKVYAAELTNQWLQVPLADLPIADARKYLAMHNTMFKELAVATSREHCEWDLRVKDLQGTEVVDFLLYDFQQMRDLVRLVALQARCDIAERKFIEAQRGIRMGYRIARDTAEVPLLINGLIGIAATAITNQVVIDWINTPNSPNLYWAIKQLPHPLVDIRPALLFELNMPFQMFPFLVDAETNPRSTQEWQALMQKMATDMNTLGGITGEGSMSDWQMKLLMTSMAIKVYPIAKQELIAGGLPAAEVEKMPVAQVLAIQTARRYRYTYHEMFKWSLLPYPEARTRMMETQERLRREGYLSRPLAGQDVVPIASLLLPALDGVVVAAARSDRRFAALETIEAMRMQAAVDGAKLPASLTAVSVVPVPPNPFTGQAFEYRLHSKTQAVLEETSTNIDPARAGDRRYLIELIQAAK